jgi:hypothetical protein
MSSVADELRRRAQAQVLAMPMAARVELALSLGDDDLELFMRVNGLDRDEASRRLRAQRQRGRPSSVTNSSRRS